MDLAEHGLSFGRQMAKKAGLPEDDEIARVFARTPRETFLGPPPWRIFASEGEGTLVDDPATAVPGCSGSD